MISSALISDDYDAARFLLASGAFGDSLNHAYKSNMEGIARQFIYAYDKTNELNIKAHLLKAFSEDKAGAYISKLIANGIFTGFISEAWKNYEAAREALNDLLLTSNKEPIPKEVTVDLDVSKLKPYLLDCLSFEKFNLHEKNQHDLREMIIEGPFFARTLTINYRRFLYDIVAMNPQKKHHYRQRKR